VATFWSSRFDGIHDQPAEHRYFVFNCVLTFILIAFIKEWTDYLTNYDIAEIHAHIKPRVYRDIIRVKDWMFTVKLILQDLPQELKHEVLLYLDVTSLVNAMSVSTAWFQICSDPLLWKNLYFQGEWTIAEEVMRNFEKRLLQLQLRFNSQLCQIRSSTVSFNSGVQTPSTSTASHIKGTDVENGRFTQQQSSFRHLYDHFFNVLKSVVAVPSGTNSYTRSCQLRKVFGAILNLEIGEPFCHAATFMCNSNGTIHICVDWHYLYMNRSLLDKNWKDGSYQVALLDGAPDVIPPGQREGIYCVVSNRKFLLTGSRDNLIRLWDMEDFSYCGKLGSHEGSVLCLQLDSKRDILISGSSDSTIKVWHLETRQVVQTLHGHTGSVLGLHFEDDYIVSCSKDTTACVWKLSDSLDSEDVSRITNDSRNECSGAFRKFDLLHTLKGHKAAVNSVHFKDCIVATASGDRTVRLWNLRTGVTIRTIAAHGTTIACVTLTKEFVVTGSSDHNIKLFDLETGEEVRTLKGHTGLVRTIQADNTKVVSGSYDQSIRIWDIKTGRMLQKLSGCHDSKYISCL
jgi:WD40 repeat protein